MSTELNDAAFRLVSHYLTSIDADPRDPKTDEERLVALRVEFPGHARQELAEALERAHRLEQTAIAMAGAFRGPSDGHRGAPLTREAMAERCPGFSESSYGWAVNDGLTRTRK